MKRTMLKPSMTPLKRSPLRTVSKKRRKLNVKRREFTSAMLLVRPNCELRSPVCTGRSQAIDEALKRSAGGAIIPGQLAEAQGQRFYAACHPCNTYKEDHPRWAMEQGFTISRHEGKRRA